VCKYFLEAVENNTYGWFWTCQNSPICQYRHALPPGFMLKRDRKLLEEQKETISLEDLIESERAGLGACVTKVTLESFLAWKKRKIEEKKQQLVKDEEKKRNDFVKHGRLVGLSGREMFTFNPDLIANDDEDADNDIDYRHRSDDEEEEEEEEQDNNNDEANEQATASAIRKRAIRDLDDMDLLAKEAREVDNTGTIATEDRFENYRKLEREKQQRREVAAAQAALAAEANMLDQASGNVASACASATTYNDTTSTANNEDDDDDEDEDDGEEEAVQIDEDLFADDLDDVEEQLRETNLTS
ncbi:unnamed protein product, partial [Rotaria sp. Silwood1]